MVAPECEDCPLNLANELVAFHIFTHLDRSRAILGLRRGLHRDHYHPSRTCIDMRILRKLSMSADILRKSVYHPFSLSPMETEGLRVYKRRVTEHPKYIICFLKVFVGFLSILAMILAPFLGGVIALVSFTNWITAALFAGALAILSYLAAVRHDLHSRQGAYDDRLTDARMREATERHVQGVKDKIVES
jgi:hypothetical protein